MKKPAKRPERDRRGRWKKGSSGNLRGRPRKWSRIENADLEAFIGEVMEVQTAHGPKMMSRDGVLLNRLFQSAMQGNVQAQIYLHKKFEAWRQVRGSIAATLDEYYAAKIDDPNYEYTAAQKVAMAAAEKILFEPKDPYKIQNPPRAPRKRYRRKHTRSSN